MEELNWMIVLLDKKPHLESLLYNYAPYFLFAVTELSGLPLFSVYNTTRLRIIYLQ